MSCRNFSKEQISEAVKNTKSASQASAYLGCPFSTYKRYAKKYGLYITNQIGKGIKRDYSKRRIPLNDILAGMYPTYATKTLRERLIKEGVKEAKCEGCSKIEWSSKGEVRKIPLELHHKNGDPRDHRKENLEILCPNCHVFTETYKGRNKAKTETELKEIRQKIENINLVLDKLPQKEIKTKSLCRECGKLCKRVDSVFCSQDCAHVPQRKIAVRPSKECLEQEIKNTSFTKLGKKYNVSDNTIRKWMKFYSLALPRRNYREKVNSTFSVAKHTETPLFPA